MLTLAARKVQRIKRYKGKTGKFIRVFLMNDQRNRNGWRVDWNAIKEHASKFVGFPGIEYEKCVAGICDLDHTDADTYKAHLKKQKPYEVGTIVDIKLDHDTHTAWAIMEITDHGTAHRIQNANLMYVSPSVWPVTGAYNIMGTDEYGNRIIDVFDFEPIHLAFVNEPAYREEARIEAQCDGGDHFCRLELVAKVQRELRASNNTGVANDTALSPIKETPLYVKHRGKGLYLEASECVQKIIQKHADEGREIDDQMLAIAYSKCGESKAAKACACKQGRINMLREKIAHLKARRSLKAATDKEGNKGVWRTTKTGKKYFIKDGQSPASALREAYGDLFEKGEKIPAVKKEKKNESEKKDIPLKEYEPKDITSPEIQEDYKRLGWNQTHEESIKRMSNQYKDLDPEIATITDDGKIKFNHSGLKNRKIPISVIKDRTESDSYDEIMLNTILALEKISPDILTDEKIDHIEILNGAEISYAGQYARSGENGRTMRLHAPSILNGIQYSGSFQNEVRRLTIHEMAHAFYYDAPPYKIHEWKSRIVEARINKTLPSFNTYPRGYWDSILIEDGLDEKSRRYVQLQKELAEVNRNGYDEEASSGIRGKYTVHPMYEKTKAEWTDLQIKIKTNRKKWGEYSNMVRKRTGNDRDKMTDEEVKTLKKYDRLQVKMKKREAELAEIIHSERAYYDWKDVLQNADRMTSEMFTTMIEEYLTGPTHRFRGQVGLDKALEIARDIFPDEMQVFDKASREGGLQWRGLPEITDLEHLNKIDESRKKRYLKGRTESHDLYTQLVYRGGEIVAVNTVDQETVLRKPFIELGKKPLKAKGAFKPDPGEVPTDGKYWRTIDGEAIPFEEGDDVEKTVAEKSQRKQEGEKIAPVQKEKKNDNALSKMWYDMEIPEDYNKDEWHIPLENQKRINIDDAQHLLDEYNIELEEGSYTFDGDEFDGYTSEPTSMEMPGKTGAMIISDVWQNMRLKGDKKPRLTINRNLFQGGHLGAYNRDTTYFEDPSNITINSPKIAPARDFERDSYADSLGTPEERAKFVLTHELCHYHYWESSTFSERTKYELEMFNRFVNGKYNPVTTYDEEKYGILNDYFTKAAKNVTKKEKKEMTDNYIKYRTNAMTRYENEVMKSDDFENMSDLKKQQRQEEILVEEREKMIEQAGGRDAKSGISKFAEMFEFIDMGVHSLAVERHATSISSHLGPHDPRMKDTKELEKSMDEIKNHFDHYKYVEGAKKYRESLKAKKKTEKSGRYYTQYQYNDNGTLSKILYLTEKPERQIVKASGSLKAKGPFQPDPGEEPWKGYFWRQIGGESIPIKEGQEVEEAYKQNSKKYKEGESEIDFDEVQPERIYADFEELGLKPPSEQMHFDKKTGDLGTKEETGAGSRYVDISEELGWIKSSFSPDMYEAGVGHSEDFFEQVGEDIAKKMADKISSHSRKDIEPLVKDWFESKPIDKRKEIGNPLFHKRGLEAFFNDKIREIIESEGNVDDKTKNVPLFKDLIHVASNMETWKEELEDEVNERHGKAVENAKYFWRGTTLDELESIDDGEDWIEYNDDDIASVSTNAYEASSFGDTVLLRLDGNKVREHDDWWKVPNYTLDGGEYDHGPSRTGMGGGLSMSYLSESEAYITTDIQWDQVGLTIYSDEKDEKVRKEMQEKYSYLGDIVFVDNLKNLDKAYTASTNEKTSLGLKVLKMQPNVKKAKDHLQRWMFKLSDEDAMQILKEGIEEMKKKKSLRAKSFKPGANEKPDAKGFYWRTIRGRKIPIRDGQSLSDAIRQNNKKMGRDPERFPVIQREKKKPITLTEFEKMSDGEKVKLLYSERLSGMGFDEKVKFFKKYNETPWQYIRDLEDKIDGDKKEKEDSDKHDPSFPFKTQQVQERKDTPKYRYKKKVYDKPSVGRITENDEYILSEEEVRKTLYTNNLVNVLPYFHSKYKKNAKMGIYKEKRVNGVFPTLEAIQVWDGLHPDYKIGARLDLANTKHIGYVVGDPDTDTVSIDPARSVKDDRWGPDPTDRVKQIVTHELAHFNWHKSDALAKMKYKAHYINELVNDKYNPVSEYDERFINEVKGKIPDTWELNMGIYQKWLQSKIDHVEERGNDDGWYEWRVSEKLVDGWEKEDIEKLTSMKYLDRAFESIMMERHAETIMNYLHSERTWRFKTEEEFEKSLKEIAQHFPEQWKRIQKAHKHRGLSAKIHKGDVERPFYTQYIIKENGQIDTVYLEDEPDQVIISENENAPLKAAFDKYGNKGVWRTTKTGKKYFIQEGESPAQAIKQAYPHFFDRRGEKIPAIQRKSDASLSIDEWLQKTESVEQAKGVQDRHPAKQAGRIAPIEYYEDSKKTTPKHVQALIKKEWANIPEKYAKYPSRLLVVDLPADRLPKELRNAGGIFWPTLRPGIYTPEAEIPMTEQAVMYFPETDKFKDYEYQEGILRKIKEEIPMLLRHESAHAAYYHPFNDLKRHKWEQSVIDNFYNRQPITAYTKKIKNTYKFDEIKNSDTVNKWREMIDKKIPHLENMEKALQAGDRNLAWEHHAASEKIAREFVQYMEEKSGESYRPGYKHPEVMKIHSIQIYAAEQFADYVAYKYGNVSPAWERDIDRDVSKSFDSLYERDWSTLYARLGSKLNRLPYNAVQIAPNLVKVYNFDGLDLKNYVIYRVPEKKGESLSAKESFDRDGNKGVWRTTKTGKRYFIKDGQTPASALREAYGDLFNKKEGEKIPAVKKEKKDPNKFARSNYDYEIRKAGLIEYPEMGDDPIKNMENVQKTNEAFMDHMQFLEIKVKQYIMDGNWMQDNYDKITTALGLSKEIGHEGLVRHLNGIEWTEKPPEELMDIIPPVKGIKELQGMMLRRANYRYMEKFQNARYLYRGTSSREVEAMHDGTWGEKKDGKYQWASLTTNPQVAMAYAASEGGVVIAYKKEDLMRTDNLVSQGYSLRKPVKRGDRRNYTEITEPKALDSIYLEEHRLRQDADIRNIPKIINWFADDPGELIPKEDRPDQKYREIGDVRYRGQKSSKWNDEWDEYPLRTQKRHWDRHTKEVSKRTEAPKKMEKKKMGIRRFMPWATS